MLDHGIGPSASPTKQDVAANLANIRYIWMNYHYHKLKQNIWNSIVISSKGGQQKVKIFVRITTWRGARNLIWLMSTHFLEASLQCRPTEIIESLFPMIRRRWISFCCLRWTPLCLLLQMSCIGQRNTSKILDKNLQLPANGPPWRIENLLSRNAVKENNGSVAKKLLSSIMTVMTFMPLSAYQFSSNAPAVFEGLQQHPACLQLEMSIIDNGYIMTYLDSLNRDYKIAFRCLPTEIFYIASNQNGISSFIYSWTGRIMDNYVLHSRSPDYIYSPFAMDEVRRASHDSDDDLERDDVTAYSNQDWWGSSSTENEYSEMLGRQCIF